MLWLAAKSIFLFERTGFILCPYAVKIWYKTRVQSFVASGAPGTGKTSAGLRLAQLLTHSTGTKVVVSRTYRPTEAGHMIHMLDSAREDAGDDGYLLVILNEFDVWMSSFSTNSGASLPKNDKVITEVTDKDTWNEWADAIHRMDKVVVWMTTNASLDDYDPALLRAKRITKRYEVLDDKETILDVFANKVVDKTFDLRVTQVTRVTRVTQVTQVTQEASNEPWSDDTGSDDLSVPLLTAAPKQHAGLSRA